jgi:hypothetical protein
MSEITQPTAAPSRRFSLDTWAVAASVLFIVLIVAGIFPRVPW